MGKVSIKLYLILVGTIVPLDVVAWQLKKLELIALFSKSSCPKG